MQKTEIRNKKRKEVVEAIVLRKESCILVARIYNISHRTVFNWFRGKCF